MTGWLLDTNILSELRRPRPEPKVVAFVEAQPLDHLHISTVTLAEIRFGIEMVDDAGRRSELTAWLDRRVRPMFEHRVLSISEDVMLRWRLLIEEGRRAGHTFSQPDAIIAATGLHHGLTFVSRDNQRIRASPSTHSEPLAWCGIGLALRGLSGRSVIQLNCSAKTSASVASAPFRWIDSR